jgi:hypothetical protein
VSTLSGAGHALPHGPGIDLDLTGIQLTARHFAVQHPTRLRLTPRRRARASSGVQHGCSRRYKLRGRPCSAGGRTSGGGSGVWRRHERRAKHRHQVQRGRRGSRRCRRRPWALGRQSVGCKTVQPRLFTAACAACVAFDTTRKATVDGLALGDGSPPHRSRYGCPDYQNERRMNAGKLSSA